jgi:hypothetical protein
VFERGGFDVVLGNPPWEAMLFREQEFFAESRPDIAQAATGALRERMVRRLADEDPALYSSYRRAQRSAEAVRQWVQASGHYPLTGRGRINTFALFGELAVGISRGRTGMILPTGVATDDSAKLFFQLLVDESRLLSLYDFENRAHLFPAVDSRARFSLVTTGPRQTVARPAEFAFLLHDASQLADQTRLVRMSADDIALVSPNTRTAPTFGSAADAAIVFAAYRRYPILLDESRQDGGPWHAQTRPGLFNMTGDSGQFRKREQLERADLALIGSQFTGPDEVWQPLFEGKMVDFYDHRAASVVLSETAAIRQGQSEAISSGFHDDPTCEAIPRYWVAADEVHRASAGWEHDWFVAWKEVSSATNERSLIPAILPKAGVGHTLALLLPGPEQSHLAPMLLANLATLVVDYIVRQRLSGIHLLPLLVKQLPVLKPGDYDQRPSWAGPVTLAEWLRPRVGELTYTSFSLNAFARDIGWTGMPFHWNDDRRSVLTAEIDAAFMHLYGLARDDVTHVIDSFTTLRRRDEAAFQHFRTQELILEAYDAMAVGTPDRPFVSQLNPPPGDPRAAHSPSPDEAPGYWTPWSEVLAQVPQAAPGTDWLGTSAARPVKSGSGSPSRARPESTPSLFATDPASAWQSEAAIAPSEIVMGARVRHRTKGEGTVLSVRPSGKGTELLIRFGATGETWIFFGYGVLEFQQ